MVLLQTKPRNQAEIIREGRELLIKNFPVTFVSDSRFVIGAEIFELSFNHEGLFFLRGESARNRINNLDELRLIISDKLQNSSSFSPDTLFRHSFERFYKKIFIDDFSFVRPTSEIARRNKFWVEGFKSSTPHVSIFPIDSVGSFILPEYKNNPEIKSLFFQAIEKHFNDPLKAEEFCRNVTSKPNGVMLTEFDFGFHENRNSFRLVRECRTDDFVLRWQDNFKNGSLEIKLI